MIDPISLSVLAASFGGGLALVKNGLDVVAELMDVKDRFKKQKPEKDKPQPSFGESTAEHIDTDGKDAHAKLPTPLNRAATWPQVAAQVDTGDAIFQTQAWIQSAVLISLLAWIVRVGVGESVQTFALVATVPLLFTVVYAVVRIMGVSIVLQTPPAKDLITTSLAAQKLPSQTHTAVRFDEGPAPPLPTRPAPPIPVSDIHDAVPPPSTGPTASAVASSSIDAPETQASIFCAGALQAQKAPLSHTSDWSKLTTAPSALEKVGGLRKCSTCSLKIPLHGPTLPGYKWIGKLNDATLWPSEEYTGLSVPQMKYLSHSKPPAGSLFLKGLFRCFLCTEPMAWPQRHLQTHTPEEFERFRKGGT